MIKTKQKNICEKKLRFILIYFVSVVAADQSRVAGMRNSRKNSGSGG